MSEPFVSINELSKRLNVPAHTLRYWEKQFPTAIKPTTGAGGRRYYREDVANAVEYIQNLLHDQGYTIAGVKKLLAESKGVIPQSGETARAGPHKDGRKANAKDSGHDGIKGVPPPAFAGVTNHINSALRDDTPEIDAAISLLEQARAWLSDT
ncbi:MAG: MerR family transcriptional regulator [Proteobacteria bacterium]|nr:MerR family transcriptional regulator [Pseudomonadota bacterium]